MLPPKPTFFFRPLHRSLTSLPLRQQQPPEAETAPPPHLSVLADKCKSVEQIKQIHAQMITTARIHDTFAASRLLNFCALSSAGDLKYAVKLFESFPQRNSFMWNTLIRAHANSQYPLKALLLYIQMRRLGVIPGKHTFPFVLKACCGVKCVKACKQVHVHVMKSGLDLDLHVVNGLVRGYSVSGGLKDARNVFDESSERSLSIWTTMICGYAQNDCGDEAIALFHGMVEEGFEPHDVTLCVVLSACAQSGCLDLGEQIYGYIKEKGIEFGVILGTALVNMYTKNGEMVKAKNCFQRLRERNVATWNAMICGLAAHGHAKEALHFFEMVKDEGIRPNDITLVGVLSACCHAGMFEFGREVFYSMKRVYGIDPKLEHYGCMVDLLGRSGRLEEAEELVKGMVWKADVVIWGALLSACKEHRNIEIAARVGKKILELDPHNHGVNVVLSNIYAEAGEWEKVMKLRKEIKDGNLKKTPGWSLVGGSSDADSVLKGEILK